MLNDQNIIALDTFLGCLVGLSSKSLGSSNYFLTKKSIILYPEGELQLVLPGTDSVYFCYPNVK